MASFPNGVPQKEVDSDTKINPQTIQSESESNHFENKLSPETSDNCNTLENKAVEATYDFASKSDPVVRTEPDSNNQTKTDISFKTNILIPKSSSDMLQTNPDVSKTKPDVTLDSSNANLATPDVIRTQPDVILLNQDQKTSPPDVSINTPDVNESLTKPDLCQPKMNVNLPKPDVVLSETDSSHATQVSTSQPDISQITPNTIPAVSEVTSNPDVSQVTSKPDVSQVTPKPDVSQVAPPVVSQITPSPDVSQVTPKPDVSQVTPPVVSQITPSPDVSHVTPKPDVSQVTPPVVSQITPSPDVSHVTPKPDVSQVTPPVVSQVTPKPDVSQVTPIPDVSQVSPIPDVSQVTPIPDVSQVAPPVVSQVTPKPDVSHVTPKPDVSLVTPIPDVSQVTPIPDVSQVSPIPDVSQVTPIPDVSQVSPIPDVSQVTPTPDINQITPTRDVSQVTPTPDISQVTPTQDVNQVTPTRDVSQVTPTPDANQITLKSIPDVSQVKPKPVPDVRADIKTKSDALESESRKSERVKPVGAATTRPSNAPKKQISNPKPLSIGNLPPRKPPSNLKMGPPRPLNLAGGKMRKPTPTEKSEVKDISKFSSPISNFDEVIQRFTGKINLPESISEVQISEKDIELCRKIGEGVSGTVYIVKHKSSGFTMAAKKMKWNPQIEEQKRILMDLEIMSIQKSPYIVVYYGSLVCRDNAWLYMELMNTCLDKLIKKFGPMPEKIVGKVVVSTLRALDYLKSVHDIIHRDVKPSNILINKKGEIKMCDFGISKQLVESRAETRGAGPTAYISPERVDIELKEYDVRADVWSLGISVIELLTGNLPYSHCISDFEVVSKILKEPAPSLPKDLQVSQECRDFIELCLRKDFKIRPKFRDLLDTSEFVKFYEKKEVDVAGWYLSLNEK